MKTSSSRLTVLLMLIVIFSVTFLHHPSVYANDSTKIVLPAVSDRSGYNSPALNAALLNKLRSQFRFPKYETILYPALPLAPDRSALEKITVAAGADGAAVVEISYLRNHTYHSFYGDEILESTDLSLTLTYFDKKTDKYGQIKAKRSATELLSVLSGPVPLALEALEELLNQLDKVFPRQFPGPRY